MRAALLHGFAGTPSAWDAVFHAWRLPVAPRAIALPGHGGGEVKASWEENLDAVPLDGIDVVIGYSLGARIALGLLASGRIARAVLVSVNPGIPDDERPARRAGDAAWATMLRTEGLAAFEARWTAQPLFASQVGAEPAERDRRRAERLALDPEQLARSLETMGLAAMPDYRRTLATMPDRAALIVGAEDAKYVAIAGAFPAHPLEVIANSGHDPTLEQPVRLADAIARAVVRLA